MVNILNLDIFLIDKNGKNEYNRDPYFSEENIKGNNLYYSLNVNCGNYERYKKLKEIKILTSKGEYFKLNKIIDFSKLNNTVVFVFNRIK